ncbi:MAG: NUDIX domain-containing protein [Clostridium sp.]|uniref:NUDIX hydrolase n=1 Tax=unclassified Clostridium TaxID=2614128 RepID=UPI00189BC735|nr:MULTISPECIES: NUDIX domain-containing protein [unclassified Clostridium]MBS4957922.1 NUDIX domain-containing protein [Clostridium sp.]MCR1950523.1 NUDIX domain-containing protein [Clostridium sp. DSM 100503]MDU2155204.1 NUDIX domain-containing protein [Clostridium sp.]
MKIEFYEKNIVENEKLLYAIIVSRYKNKWIFVKHKERDTWEIPAGHREINEDINFTAKRELFEETGAKEFEILYMNDYSLEINGKKSYAALFFAEIYSLGDLPDFEIGEIKEFDNIPKNLTYPDIQPKLFEKIKEVLKVNINKL